MMATRRLCLLSLLILFGMAGSVSAQDDDSPPLPMAGDWVVFPAVETNYTVMGELYYDISDSAAYFVSVSLEDEGRTLVLAGWRSIAPYAEELETPLVVRLARGIGDTYFGTQVWEQDEFMDIASDFVLTVDTPDRILMSEIFFVFEGGTGQDAIMLHAPAPFDPRTSGETTMCPDVPVSQLEVGGFGTVVTFEAQPMFARADVSSNVVGDVPGYQDEGGPFEVLEGPACDEIAAWWLVEYAGVTGWMAEAFEGQYALWPTGSFAAEAEQIVSCEDALPSRLAPGDFAVVIEGPPNNVRRFPAVDAELLGEIPGEGGFIVLDGPACADGYAWWLVNYGAIIGWTAEGGDDYWLSPYDLLAPSAS
jgi:hypothetical protein